MPHLLGTGCMHTPAPSMDMPRPQFTPHRRSHLGARPNTATCSSSNDCRPFDCLPDTTSLTCSTSVTQRNSLRGSSSSSTRSPRPSSHPQNHAPGLHCRKRAPFTMLSTCRQKASACRWRGVRPPCAPYPLLPHSFLSYVGVRVKRHVSRALPPHCARSHRPTVLRPSLPSQLLWPPIPKQAATHNFNPQPGHPPLSFAPRLPLTARCLLLSSHTAPDAYFTPLARRASCPDQALDKNREPPPIGKAARTSRLPSHGPMPVSRSKATKNAFIPPAFHSFRQVNHSVSYSALLT